jgi:hypothetical protein
MLSKISKFVLLVALSGFVAVVLLDPSDHILHLKLPLLILTLGVWATRVTCSLVNLGGFKTWAAILLFVVIFPGMASIIGFLGHSFPVGDPSFQLMKEFTVILIIPVVVSEGIDLTKHIIGWSFVIVIFTLVLAVLSLTAPLIFSIVTDFTLEKDNALLNPYDKLGLGMGTIYYRTTAVLVFPIAYYLWRSLNRPKKIISYILTTIFLVCVLCSGSRATIIASYVIFAFFMTQKFKYKYGRGAALSILFIMVTLPAGYFATFFHPGDASNAAKLGHIRSYAVLFDDHPTYLLWGQGADTEFYTEGFQAKTTLTELTYLDLIRWFGLPVTAIILIAVLYPVFGLMRLTGEVSYLAVPYAAYLLEAATNPLLICSFGALVVSAVWGVFLMHNAKQTTAYLRRS